MKQNNNEMQILVKTSTLILLSYIVPVFGVVFSIYLLMNADIIRYANWVKALATISLVLQLLIISGMVIGWLAWMFS